MITFRYPQKGDIVEINRWYQDPTVITFYNSGTILPEVTSLDRYLPSQDGEVLVIERDQQAIGLLSVGFYTATTVSIVYFIGDHDVRGKGTGGQMLREFVTYAATRGWRTINASVSVVNYPSWKALINAGFRFSGKKKDVERYPIIADRDFDQLSLFCAPTCSDIEEEIHQLIATNIIGDQEVLLNYFKQVIK